GRWRARAPSRGAGRGRSRPCTSPAAPSLSVDEAQGTRRRRATPTGLVRIRVGLCPSRYAIVPGGAVRPWLWEATSSHWPTADQAPDVTPAHAELARRWREMPRVVLSSSPVPVDWNTRLHSGDAVAESRRLKAADGGPAGRRGGARRPGGRVRGRHPPRDHRRGHAVLPAPRAVDRAGPGRDADVPRRGGADAVRDESVTLSVASGHAPGDRARRRPGTSGPGAGREESGFWCGVVAARPDIAVGQVRLARRRHREPGDVVGRPFRVASHPQAVGRAPEDHAGGEPRVAE